MSEVSGFNPEAKFTPPPIDLKVEAVTPEDEAELNGIIEKYSSLIGVVVTEKGLREFYEDILHSQQYGYFVIDDFFVDGTGDILTGRNRDMKTIGLKDTLMQFCEELTDFALQRAGGGNEPAHAHVSEGRGSNPKHVDADSTVMLANFDVVGDMYYELRPFVNDSVLFEDPDHLIAGSTPGKSRLPDERDNSEIFLNDTIEIPIKSNQLVFLEQAVRTKLDEKSRTVTLPHGVVVAEGQGPDIQPSRTRLTVAGGSIY